MLKVLFLSWHLGCIPCHLSDCDRYFAFIILTICKISKMVSWSLTIQLVRGRTNHVTVPIAIKLFCIILSRDHIRTNSSWHTHSHTYMHALLHKCYYFSLNNAPYTHTNIYIAQHQAVGSCEWSDIVTSTYAALSHCEFCQRIIPSNKSCLEDNPFPIFWTDTFCNEMAPGPSL